MPTVQFIRFFPTSMSAEDACSRIESAVADLKTPKSKSNAAWQRVLRDAIAGYIREARSAPHYAKKWRNIAEAMFWWADAFSTSSGTPFCQQLGADAQTAGRKKRIAEAWAIFKRGDPETGKPWPSKEKCKTHLMATKHWSRSSCNTYLKDENKV